MAKEQESLPEGDIPWDQLAAPARRALTGAGYYRLEDLANVTEAQVKQLHGIGPNAIKTLRAALQAQGLAFSSQT